MAGRAANTSQGEGVPSMSISDVKQRANAVGTPRQTQVPPDTGVSGGIRVCSRRTGQ